MPNLVPLFSSKYSRRRVLLVAGEASRHMCSILVLLVPLGNRLHIEMCGLKYSTYMFLLCGQDVGNGGLAMAVGGGTRRDEADSGGDGGRGGRGGRYSGVLLRQYRARVGHRRRPLLVRLKEEFERLIG